MRFDITLEGVDATLVNLDLMDKAVGRGVVSGLNKIGAQGRTLSVRSITGFYNIKAKDIKQGVSLTRARAASGRSRGRMFASIRAKAGSFPLMSFGGLPKEPVSQKGIPRGTGKGRGGGGRPYPGRRRASIKMRKQGSRIEVRHGFLVRTRGGRVGIFQRTGQFRGKREVIREMRSIGVAAMFRTSSVKALNRLMRDKGPAILRHEIGYHLSRARMRRTA